MNKPNVLIMTDKFAEVSREPIEILINAGMRVHEHGYNTAGSINDDKFCELENVVSTCHIAGLSDDASYAMAMQTVEKIIACLSGRIPTDVLTPGISPCVAYTTWQRMANGLLL